MKRLPSSSLFSSTTSSTRVCSFTFQSWQALIPWAAVHNAQPGWRRIIAQAVLWGIPTPAFSTALAFFDGYRSEIVPANLLQAQVRRLLAIV
jgi:6-phosphogluconate dehydrogenase